MKKYFLCLLLVGFYSAVAYGKAITYGKEILVNVKTGLIVIPNSSIIKAKDFQKRVHTNYMIFYSNTKHQPKIMSTPDQLQCETPASLACIYGLTRPTPGCSVNSTSAIPTGGWGAIAIVGAYDYPTAEEDLNTFSAAFGLPPCTTDNGCFQRVYAADFKPNYDADWSIEAALDIEWAHAMAPNAKIILVEANSNRIDDMFFAEDVASKLVQDNGGGAVSNSWGTVEFPEEISFDEHFQQPGVVYFASSGDQGAPSDYPGTSAYVVSAGGTSIIRQNGNFIQETAWSLTPTGKGGGGGPSLYEARPFYQNTLRKIIGTQRGTPDFSFNANPETGVAVYSSTTGWIIVGGTSVSAPALAGIIIAGNSRALSTSEELNLIYQTSVKNYHSNWHDIIIGNNRYPALPGYDFATGLGSILGYKGK